LDIGYSFPGSSARENFPPISDIRERLSGDPCSPEESCALHEFAGLYNGSIGRMTGLRNGKIELGRRIRILTSELAPKSEAI